MFERAQSWLVGRYQLLILIILLIAAALRLYGLNNLSPPGLEHDEVAHWLINRDILAGKHSLYFAEAFGHEAGFHYLQTGFMVLLGDNVLALRLPAAFAGLLLVAVSFALNRRLFGLWTALLAAGLLAVLLWPVFYSRLALRAISLPLVTGMSATFWWRGWQQSYPERSEGGSTRRLRRLLNNPLLAFSLAGLLAGLSLYTYLASRVVPIFFVLYIAYLLLFHRPALRQHRRGMLLFFGAYVIVAAPLVIFLLANPGAEARISEVNAPLKALMDGRLGPALENSLGFLGMFGLRGDPLWRQNVAFLPVFEPLVAAFFYIGLVIGLWRWQEPRYLFIILWLFTAAIPSIVTIDAPSSIRIINVLPVLTVFPFIGLQVIHFFRPLSTVGKGLSTKIGEKAVLVTLVLLFAVYIGRTTRSLFQTWPAAEEVQFVWQQALTEAAAHLDASPEDGPVAIGGWTPETMDPPTMALTLHRDDLSLRYFDPSQTLIVPALPDAASDAEQAGRIIHPTILPLDPFLEAQLMAWGATSNVGDSFTRYEVTEMPAVRPQFPVEITFDEQLTFLGHEWLSSCTAPPDESAAGRCDLVTYWRIQKAADGPRRFFLHLVNVNGEILAQDDRLGAPAAHWRPGDIIVQHHSLAVPAAEETLTWRLGVYDPDTRRRLVTDGGADFVELAEAEETFN